MSTLDHDSARHARADRTPSFVAAALAMMTIALPSYAASGRPTFHVEHVQPVEGAPPSLAIELQLTRARGTRSSVLAPADSESFTIQLLASGRCLRSGLMRVASLPTARRQSLVCLLQLADCDSVPRDGRVLVEAADGRVLARAQWHFRSHGPPADGTSSMMAGPDRAVPIGNMQIQATGTIPTVRVTWGFLKTLYR